MSTIFHLQMGGRRKPPSKYVPTHSSGVGMILLWRGPHSVCILAAPVLGGNSGTSGGTTRRRSLRPEGPKIEAEGRGRGGVLGEGAATEIEFWHILA